jgi:hypothetical protein
VKGGRKNWDEHETKTTNDAPQEGRNNRRTLLITGGKLGSRPTTALSGVTREEQNEHSQSSENTIGYIGLCGNDLIANR